MAAADGPVSVTLPETGRPMTVEIGGARSHGGRRRSGQPGMSRVVERHEFTTTPIAEVDDPQELVLRSSTASR
jgi:hypothetical protein